MRHTTIALGIIAWLIAAVTALYLAFRPAAPRPAEHGPPDRLRPPQSCTDHIRPV